jgi:hypothetical protein
MNKFIIISLTLSVSLTLSIACRKNNRCEEPYDVRQSAIILIFKNSAGNYLYAEANPLFEKDSLKIYDESGSRMAVASGLDLIPNTSLRFWKFDFGPIYNSLSDEGAFNSELCKKFVIKYFNNKADTITTCFKASKFKCGSEFSSLKVFHKGILLSEVNNHILTTVTVINN